MPEFGQEEDAVFSRGLSAFLLSQFVSLIGDRVATLAYVSLAARAAPDHAGAAAANVAAIQIAPVLLFSYWGGVLSDRLSRKWLMWWIDVGRLAVVAVFLVSYRGGLWPIYGVVLLLGTLSALFNPAKRSFIPFLVSRRNIAWANWWMANSEVVAMLAGIAAGSALLSVTSPQRSLIFDCLSFGLALVILLSVSNSLPRAPADSVHHLAQIKAGLQILCRAPTVRGILLRLNLPLYLAAGLFYASASHWAAEREPGNTGAPLGLLLLALAAGALCAFSIRRQLEALGERLGAAVTFAAGAGCIAILAALARSPLAWVLVSTFLCGVAVGLLYVRSTYLLHLHAPPEVIGRLVSLREILEAVAFSGAVAATGALGDRFSVGWGWLCAALIFAAGSIAVARFDFDSGRLGQISP